MRFNLLGILIGCAISSLAASLSLFISINIGKNTIPSLGIILTIILTIALHSIVTPLIYRKFRMKPLFLPTCPYCHSKDKLYYSLAKQPSWPTEEVICAYCSHKLELQYEVLKSKCGHKKGVVRLQLLWPQSWGRWKQLDPIVLSTSERK